MLKLIRSKIAEGKSCYGSKDSPYIIKNINDLQGIRSIESTEGMYFSLESDLDLKGIEWIPFPFSGNLDGNMHTIKNIRIKDDSKFTGLFSVLGENDSSASSVSNLIIENINISGSPSELAYAGGIAGSMYGVDSFIDNVYLSGRIESGGSVGGLIGYLEKSNIRNSEVQISLIAGSNCGGFVGYSEFGYISDSIAKGKIYSALSTGGIVGASMAVSVKRCLSEADLSGEISAGGIIGYSAGSVVRKSLVNGKVFCGDGERVSGGVVGHTDLNMLIVESYYSLEGTGQSDRGKGIGINEVEFKEKYSSFLEREQSCTVLFLFNIAV